MPKPKTPKRATAPRSPRAIAKLAMAALTDMLIHSDSDSVRVTAARTLMDRVRPTETDADRRRARKDHAAALAEVYSLLDELAALKTERAADPAPDRDGGVAALDTERTGDTTDATE